VPLRYRFSLGDSADLTSGSTAQEVAHLVSQKMPSDALQPLWHGLFSQVRNFCQHCARSCATFECRSLKNQSKRMTLPYKALIYIDKNSLAQILYGCASPVRQLSATG
ncbi:hypothetical protein, partial [Pseudomonas sp. ES1]|uniref:hypothetical protein n=1 Tax=Pseudomonas sp. ES1 TaxID=3424775 RepID=UPI003D351D49